MWDSKALLLAAVALTISNGSKIVGGQGSGAAAHWVEIKPSAAGFLLVKSARLSGGL